MTKNLGQIDQEAQYKGNGSIIQILKHFRTGFRTRLAHPESIAQNMKPSSRLIILASAVFLSACATMFPQAVAVGDSEADVIARRGQPTYRYQDGKDRLLEYKMGPWGQRTYMARIGPDGRVVSFEQVLTTQKFATIKVGEATKNDVLKTIGGPSETSYLPLRDLEVWSYPYKEADVWNSLMHVHFDRSGVVQQMMNGPDPRFDPDRRFPFSMMR
ncbi:hypothetical protein [Noviherbaspirillum sp.]|uniref:hypothetical protein n=1 Tax=Noviherbaspirillum sp. TaxID=1926288 RepID=UPI002D49D95F|nr:hypothetical protein [Noviherbaspirillum sp.]HZW22761.1 hypothetical protein [Noviherbaspirillum sp.]